VEGAEEAVLKVEALQLESPHLDVKAQTKDGIPSPRTAKKKSIRAITIDDDF
jgi:hypothetical protein